MIFGPIIAALRGIWALVNSAQNIFWLLTLLISTLIIYTVVRLVIGGLEQ